VLPRQVKNYGRDPLTDIFEFAVPVQKNLRQQALLQRKGTLHTRNAAAPSSAGTTTRASTMVERACAEEVPALEILEQP